MIQVYNNTKFYVYCPAGIVSGGAELLHQLVSLLRDNGKDAFIVYYGNKEHVIPDDYKNYNVIMADMVIDREYNIEILFEPLFYRVCLNTKIQKMLWWLSVDNFYRCSDNYLAVLDIAKYDMKSAMRVFAKRVYHFLFTHKNYFKHSLSLKDLSRVNVVSAYQSEYAQNFLQNNGFNELVALKDFINIEHCSSFTKENREDIILYNPKKGLSFTKKLIRMAPDLRWIPIENMSRNDVILLMKKAKVYVDFGFHPGKDRLPRECAMNGLCIITGKRGSAAFFEDIPIENKYKFDERFSEKSKIIQTIKEVLYNYATAIDDFKFYRFMISQEKTEFERQVNQLFIVNSKK